MEPELPNETRRGTRHALVLMIILQHASQRLTSDKKAELEALLQPEIDQHIPGGSLYPHETDTRSLRASFYHPYEDCSSEVIEQSLGQIVQLEKQRESMWSSMWGQEIGWFRAGKLEGNLRENVSTLIEQDKALAKTYAKLLTHARIIVSVSSWFLGNLYERMREIT